MSRPTMAEVRETPCPKCGSKLMCDPNHHANVVDSLGETITVDEWMSLECSCCGYTRQALPLDAEGGTK